jgi:hypothetical protein
MKCISIGTESVHARQNLWHARVTIVRLETHRTAEKLSKIIYSNRLKGGIRGLSAQENTRVL